MADHDPVRARWAVQVGTADQDARTNRQREYPELILHQNSSRLAILRTRAAGRRSSTTRMISCPNSIAHYVFFRSNRFVRVMDQDCFWLHVRQMTRGGRASE